MNQEELVAAIYQAEKLWHTPMSSSRRDPKFTIFLGEQDYYEVLRDCGLAAHISQPSPSRPLELYGHPVYRVHMSRFLKVIAE